MENGNGTPENIIRKIRALLNMTVKQGCTEAETATALGMAQALLEKYNLAMDDIKIEKGPIKEDLIRDDVPVGFFSWEQSLVNIIAKNNMCSTVFLRGERKIAIMGRKTNVSVVKEMVWWIVPQLENLVAQALHNYLGSSGRMQYRNGFLNGAVIRIGERLRDMRQERHMADPSIRALVLVRDTEVREYVSQQFPKLVNRSHRFSISGYDDGKKAGDKVSLFGANRQVISGHQLPSGK